MAIDNQRLESSKEQNDERETAERWLKSKEIKQFLGISESGLQKLRRDGVLPYSRLGGIYFYDLREVLKMLNANRRNNND